MRATPASSIQSKIVGLDDAKRPLIVCIHGGGCNANYFDLPGFSFCDLAVARGYSLVLINRPGHGGSSPTYATDFTSIASAILAHIHDTISVHRPTSRWLLLGHSIGAAVATIIAGEICPAHLVGVALSGIGDKPTSAAWAWQRELDAALPGAALSSDLLFGPPGSFSWRAPKALRHAAEPWQTAEVHEALDHWPSRFVSSAHGVKVPVHIRLAEAEQIWDTGQDAVERVAKLFDSAPRVDAGLLPEGGHLYEVHRRGHELMKSQLDFFDNLTARLDSFHTAGIPLIP